MATILVVDGDGPYRTAFRLAAEAVGHRVVEASGSRDALQRIREDPDLMVLDHGIDGRSGFRFLDQVMDLHLVRCPVVVTSTVPDAWVRHATCEHGADHYRTKPSSLAGVRELLRVGLLKPSRILHSGTG